MTELTFEERLAHAVIMRALHERSSKFFRRDSPDLQFWCAISGTDPGAVIDAAQQRWERLDRKGVA